MLPEIKKNLTSFKILVTLLIITVGIYLFQIFSQVLANFSDVIIILICSWLLSFVLSPFVNALTITLRISKIISAFIVYAVFFALIAVIIQSFIPTVYQQIQQLVQILPKYINAAPPFMHNWLGIASTYLDNSLPILSSVATILFDMSLVLIISFYFVIDSERINKELYELTPNKWHKDMEFIQHVINTTFASFIRVQLLFGLLAGVATWIVLRIFNVEFAASTALLSGILAVIPMVGPILTIIPPLLLPLLTNTTQALIIFVILLAIGQLIFNIIGPKLLSKTFKIHPVIVLLSFLVGFKIAGTLGAIFAVPVLGIIIIVFHQLSRHFISEKNKTS
ncbi:MAG TPA: AI-2E family transporter [Candidatus Saccharimonadales bacterium]|nr:AI-2E family transporter [Candidatus Saccharimonadales bacterium]